MHTKSTKPLENKFLTFEARIPADIIFTPQPPKDLRKLEQTPETGQRWITDAQFAVMRMPSIIAREPNYILNPLRPGVFQKGWREDNRVTIKCFVDLLRFTAPASG